MNLQLAYLPQALARLHARARRLVEQPKSTTVQIADLIMDTHTHQVLAQKACLAFVGHDQTCSQARAGDLSSSHADRFDLFPDSKISSS